jgi:hypothetical protein
MLSCSSSHDQPRPTTSPCRLRSDDLVRFRLFSSSDYPTLSYQGVAAEDLAHLGLFSSSSRSSVYVLALMHDNAPWFNDLFKQTNQESIRGHASYGELYEHEQSHHAHTRLGVRAWLRLNRIRRGVLGYCGSTAPQSDTLALLACF